MKKICVIILLSLFSCEKPVSKSYYIEKNDVESDNLDLGTLIKWDTLFLSARFDECGEWGGHKEMIEIFKKDKNFYLNYRKNNIDCNKVDEINEVKLSLIKELEINSKQQYAIKEYLYQLLQNKIDEGSHAHSGKEFGVLKGDSTFFIKVYDNNPNNIVNYNSLLKKLSLK